MQAALAPIGNWLIILPVLLPLLGAALLLVLRKTAMPAMVAMLLVAAAGVCDLLLLLRVFAGGPVSMTMGRWLPPFGISFTADVMGATFALASAVLAFIVLVYAAGRPAEANGGSFHALLLLLVAGVHGAFLTGDLFNLYVWFEVMLIASFGLLILSGTPMALDGAVKYGLLNFLGTSLFLASLGLLYGTLGTLNMADIIGVAGKANPAILSSIAALLVVAFGTKAAAFPLNAWLPASYHTPPAVVSALFGGLLTKVGVYALLRTLVFLLPASRETLQPMLAAVAILTLLLAPLGALAETNLRRAIGYLLIGGIGAILVGIALPTGNSLAGAVVYVVHAMFSIGALYLLAGLIEAQTGEVDVRRMHGLYVARPLLAGLFFVLIVGVAGVPPFLGFWPKLLLLEGTIEPVGTPQQPGLTGSILAACLVLNALLTLIAGARLWAQIFWRSDSEGQGVEAAGTPALDKAGRGDLLRLGAVLALVGAILVLGLWPEPLLALGRAAAAGLLAPKAYIDAVGLETIR